MAYQKITRFLSLLTLLGIMSSNAYAQEVLFEDHPNGLRVNGRIDVLKDDHSSALRAAGTQVFAPFPFFDDFSYDSLAPSGSNWNVMVGSSAASKRIPGVSVRKGVKAPSKGVCSFDGATFDGGMHEGILAFGFADSLASNPIDLSTTTPGDSIYLSFFFQRGGMNDGPEATDSLILYFDSTGNHDYTRVWAAGGAAVRDTMFQLAMVPVTAANFLHGNFRFKFENLGSLNGEFDVWHLDYVQMAKSRSFNQPIQADLSPSLVTVSPLAPWTSIPRDHFGLSSRAALPSVQYSNPGTAMISGSANASISDPVGGNVLTGTQSVSFAALSVPGNGAIIASPSSNFSDQAGSFLSTGQLRMRTVTTSASDAYHGNDTLDFSCAIDTVLGFDDGTSDAAYGLTAARSFCQEYRIPVQDTLTAVWIAFTPYLYVSPGGLSTSLENKNFRLSVWDTLVVDSFLVQTGQGMNVAYGNGLNQFVRYPLSNPKIVDTLFWVGIRQVDQMPLGVGFDRNLNISPVYFEASNGLFQLSTNTGTLMIRPEFGTTRAPVGLADEILPKRADLQVFPNPLEQGNLTINVLAAPTLRPLGVRVYSVEGRMIHDATWPAGSTEMELARGCFPASGVYLVLTEFETKDRQLVRASRRVVIR